MQKIDKLYFDIDGVIRGVASPKEDVIALLRYCLDNCLGAVSVVVAQIVVFGADTIAHFVGFAFVVAELV